ncbi:arsenate reductase family protein [Enterococcus cecorum]|nr:arsenate reductase family protein [Enterococcus cecorum]KLN92618.1 hypothetical protein ABT59_06530 [Enterococcus cecorum]KLN92853.1 hypothetical protein ABT60_07595 [Enterococcus cecorum]KLO64712.1 hypothetical protein AA986_10155 [Enterococcus cecorum]KLO66644.1 hypothetical protein AA985_04855 [Enterococcus cecorum]KLO69083.1 hypothetical protein AA989_12305 [Enterococcus cecorum]
MYTLYWYPKCSTCKKAVKHLENKGIMPELIDIKENPPKANQLQDWMEQSELPMRRFFNTSGMKYKELHLKDKVDTLSMKEACELLATDGMLIKRPILLKDGVFVSIGYKEAVYERLDA